MTHLTRREIEVCGYLCKGWNGKEIGRKLLISHRTVEDHRQQILRKYHCRNVVELVLTVYDIPDEPAA